jgi:Tfp pilus assembly protein FimT
MEYLAYLANEERIRRLRAEADAWRLAHSAQLSRRDAVQTQREQPEITCRRAAARPAHCGGLS